VPGPRSGEPDRSEGEAELRRRIQALERAAEVRDAVLAEAVGREERELATARRIQASMMPRTFPSWPGVGIAARYRAARAIGGDIYDVYPSRSDEEGRLGLAVADVTGKGVTAALLMAFCRAIMRTAAWNAGGPADTLARVNHVLARDVRSGLFVTAVVAELDAVGGRVRWASAGHEPPLLVRLDGTVSELPAGGIMLGLLDGAPFVEHRCLLRPGETFLLLTDGIIDATDRKGRRLGPVRLRRVLREHADADPGELLDAIVDAVDSFADGTTQADDLTLLAVRRTGVDEAGEGRPV
jgi:sigma-B regulation protein RsbU (phosphoserine phosphatase)